MFSLKKSKNFTSNITQSFGSIKENGLKPSKLSPTPRSPGFLNAIYENTEYKPDIDGTIKTNIDPKTTTKSSPSTLSSSNLSSSSSTSLSSLPPTSSKEKAAKITKVKTATKDVEDKRPKSLQVKSDLDLFVYSNHIYDNHGFVKESYNKRIFLPAGTNSKLVSKEHSPNASKRSLANSKNSKDAVFSMADKVPFSYNVTGSLTHGEKSSSSSLLSSIALSNPNSSGYLSTSSLSHSSSMPTLTSSSSTLKSSTTDTTSLSSNKSRRSDDIWLSKFELTLKSSAKEKAYVTSDQVKDALQVKESFFTDRFLELLDKDRDGQIGVERLLEELRSLVCGTETEKLKFLFNVYNTKGNGHITRTELQQLFTKCIDECKIQISQENVQALTAAFFQAADRNRDGKITFEELQNLFQRRPSIVDNMSIRPGLNLIEELKARHRFRHFSKRYILNNLKKLMTMGVFILINVFLMGLGAYLYWDKNTWVKVARASGMALNFNCTFVLVLMLRRTLTWLRNTPLRNVFPFDHHVLFHRLCGYLIAFQALGHTVAHIGNCFSMSEARQGTVPELMFTTKAGVGWVGHSAYITGDILLIVLTVMVVLSLPIIRRTGFFEVFYWSHKLYLVFWAILLIHAPHFWMWFLVPGLIFIIEMIARHPWFRNFYMGKTYIEQVSLLPSDVTHLVISRPSGFHFKPGDYVFIQVPAVAKYEWHPFTISSAPENMEELWLHIRTAGHWTRSLHDYFNDYTTSDIETGSNTSNDSDLRRGYIKRRASSIAWLKSKPLKARKINARIRKRVVTKRVHVLVHIDGPYGTASRHILEEEHAVLIGSGIGITPFASILQSIVSRYQSNSVKCPKCSYQWCHQTPASVMNLKKVDFVWINRDQRHFEWFTSLLCRLEREQEVEGGLGGALDMHMYMTSLPAKTDMRGMGLQLALDLVHEEEKTDLLTGLRTRTQAGRPDFDKLFSNIKTKASGCRVKVFFCGSPLLGQTLKLYSHKYDFAFAHEYF